MVLLGCGHSKKCSTNNLNSWVKTAGTQIMCAFRCIQYLLRGFKLGGYLNRRAADRPVCDPELFTSEFYRKWHTATEFQGISTKLQLHFSTFDALLTCTRPIATTENLLSLSPSTMQKFGFGIAFTKRIYMGRGNISRACYQLGHCLK